MCEFYLFMRTSSPTVYIYIYTYDVVHTKIFKSSIMCSKGIAGCDVKSYYIIAHTYFAP